MSEPAWVALGSRGGIVDWEGGWSAGVAYQQGDVVRHNGVDYIAVNPSTGQSPAAATPVVGGRELAYAEFTATVPVGGKTEATANQIVQAPATVFDGSPVLIEFFAPAANPHNAVNSSIYFVLFQDGVSLGTVASITSPAATGYSSMPVRFARRVTPTAGTHTYAVSAYLDAGGVAGGVGAGVGGPGVTLPGFIRITLVEPAALNITTRVSDPGYGTSLPASPVNGEEYTLVDSLTAPTYSWRFRYVAAKASNRWIFVGGSPLSSFDNGPSALLGTSYATVGNGTPVVPVSGLYTVALGAGFYASGAFPSDVAHLVFSGGGIVDTSVPILVVYIGATAAQDQISGHKEWGPIPLIAGTSLVLRARRRSASGFVLQSMYLAATPIAVGG